MVGTTTTAEGWLQTTYPELYNIWRDKYLESGRREHLVPVHCRICEIRPHSGLHYGVYSCEADKQFLKRTFHDRLNYTLCDLHCSPRARGWCQYCRLRSSLLMGINLKLIRFGGRITKEVGSRGRGKPKTSPTTKFPCGKRVQRKPKPQASEWSTLKAIDSTSTSALTSTTAYHPVTVSPIWPPFHEDPYRLDPLADTSANLSSSSSPPLSHRVVAELTSTVSDTANSELPGDGSSEHVSYTDLSSSSHWKPSSVFGDEQRASPAHPHDQWPKMPQYWPMIYREKSAASPPAFESVEKLVPCTESSATFSEASQPAVLCPMPRYSSGLFFHYWQHQLYFSSGYGRELPTPSPSPPPLQLEQEAPLDLSVSSGGSTSTTPPPTSALLSPSSATTSPNRSFRSKTLESSFNKMSVNSAILQEALNLVANNTSSQLLNLSRVSDIISD